MVKASKCFAYQCLVILENEPSLKTVNPPMLPGRQYSVRVRIRQDWVWSLDLSLPCNVIAIYAKNGSLCSCHFRVGCHTVRRPLLSHYYLRLHVLHFTDINEGWL